MILNKGQNEVSLSFDSIQGAKTLCMDRIHNLFQSITSSAQLLSCVQLFATPWTAAFQASLSITNSWNLLKLVSIQLLMPSNHITLYYPPLLPSLFPSIRVFPMSWLFVSGGQITGASASASVHPMNIQD